MSGLGGLSQVSWLDLEFRSLSWDVWGCIGRYGATVGLRGFGVPEWFRVVGVGLRGYEVQSRSRFWGSGSGVSGFGDKSFFRFRVCCSRSIGSFQQLTPCPSRGYSLLEGESVCYGAYRVPTR